MSFNIKKIVSYLIPLLLGLGLLNWVFNDVDLGQTLSVFKEANYFLVFIAALIAFFSNVLRAARWNLMLNSLSYTPSLKSSTVAILLGYLTNLLLPRAGEVVRSLSLQKNENVPFDRSFGAVIAERVVDLFVLFILVAFNLLFEYQRIYDLFIHIVPPGVLWILILLLVVFLGGVFVLFRYKEKILALPVLNKFRKFIDGLIEGLTSIFKLEKRGLFVSYSFLIWLTYFLVTYILCQSIDLGSGLSPVGVLTILVIGTIGMMVPTMGGIGSYHLLVGSIVVLYGLNNQDGVTLATFLHTLNGILFVVIFGVSALLFDFLQRNKRV